MSESLNSPNRAASSLLVDLGNSRVKFGLWTQGRLHGAHSCTHAQWRAVAEGDATLLADALVQAGATLPRPASAWAVSVADDVLNTATTRLCERLGLPLHWWHKVELPAGFVNAYRAPTLGADRLLAAIAAWATDGRRRSGLVIASFGTATTVDTVLDGHYEGGMIAPGVELMLGALAQGTARLPDVPANLLRLDALAKTTPEAMAAGVGAAQRGLIDLALQQVLARTGHSAVLYVSGGAASAAAGILPAHRALPHAVLHGLGVVHDEGVFT